MLYKILKAYGQVKTNSLYHTSERSLNKIRILQSSNFGNKRTSLVVTVTEIPLPLQWLVTTKPTPPLRWCTVFLAVFLRAVSKSWHQLKSHTWSSVDVNIKIQHYNLKTAVNNSLNFQWRFDSSCCLPRTAVCCSPPKVAMENSKLSSTWLNW